MRSAALWEAARAPLPERPRGPARASPSTRSTSRRRPATPACAPATLADLDRLVPACAAAHELELGVDPLARDPEGFRWRTRPRSRRAARGSGSRTASSCFKAEASAWTPPAVQIAAGAGSTRRRAAAATAPRALRDLCRLLLATTPTVTLFVRSENAPAIALYESIGMRRVLDYRSVLF